MTWWWIGDAAMAVVVIPIIGGYLHGLMKSMRRVTQEVDACVAASGAIISQLELLGALGPTKDSTSRIRAGVAAYTAGADKVLYL